MRIVWKRISAVAVSAAGIALIASVMVFGSYLCIVAGTIILIIGVAMWQMSDEDGYNDSAAGIAKMIQNVGGVSIEDVYKEVGDMKTPFGSAWLGGVKLIRPQCVIFGPGADGSFVYIYKKHGNLYIAQCTSDFWLKSKLESPNSAWPIVKKTPWEFSREADYLVNKLYKRIGKTVGSKSGDSNKS